MGGTYVGQINIMNSKHRVFLFLGLVLIGSIVISGAVSASVLATSPQPKIHHDNNNTGQSEYKGPNTNSTKWNYKTGDRVESSPTIGSDGTIYIGSEDHKLYALNPNGTEKWTYTAGGSVDSSATIGSDGTIYFGCGDYKLYALNPNGTEKWTFTTGNIIYSSPVIGSDGTIYFGSMDHKLYALNPNGTQKWNYITGGNIFMSPAIGSDGTIYFGSDDHKLYALNPNGTEKWTYTAGNFIFFSPAIGSDGTIYFGSDDHKLYALYPNGTQKWAYTTAAYIDSAPAIGSDGTIYVGTDDSIIYALNPDGTQKWNCTIQGNIHSDITIGSDGTIYFGSNDTRLYALTPNGTLKWTYKTGGSVVSSPSIGSDGTIYFGSNDNKLYAVSDVPVANFTANTTSGTAPLNVHFTDNSTGDITGYAWDLNNDGVIDSTEQNPTYNYNTPGTYTVTETVTGPAGTNSKTFTDYINVNYPAPVANFTVNTTSGTSPQTVHFTDKSTGKVTSYAWDFNNNGVIDSTNQNPTWTYTAPGTYTVTETVTGPGGSNSQTFTNYVTINSDTSAPVVNASLIGGLFNKNQTVTLTATDNDPNLKIYYTINGNNPTTSSTLYTGPISISKEGTTTLRFIAVDTAGNISNIVTRTYTIDTTAPKANSNPVGGLYNTNKTVKISMNENGTIYYTLNGATPTRTCTKYTGPITISSTTTLKFLAVDLAGNKSPIYTQTYTIDKTAPKVLTTTPINNKANISKTAVITVKFTERIKSSIFYKYIKVKNLKTGKYISISKAISGNILTIKTGTKNRNTWYTVIIPKSAIKDSAGNNLKTSYSFKFQTGK